MKSGGVVLSRRQVVVALAGLAAMLSTTALTPPSLAEDTAPAAFSFDMLSERMRRLAAAPFATDEAPLPPVLKALDYDSYRMIQARNDKSVALSDGFGYFIQPFHLGWLFQQPVEMFEAADGTAKAIPFSAADFDYHDPAVEKEMAAITLPGVAGFRIDGPMMAPSQMDEIVAFLGASYFRALGRGNAYGGSARGAVVNSWLTGPEDFPRFSQFYVEKAQWGEPLTLYAALEGQSLTGAFKFELDPGNADRQATVFEVTARFFFRTDIAEMGVAPLTSMYLYSEANRSQFDDYRPEVHDSDGLMFDAGTGEIAWRALNNPPTLGNSYFSATNPKAFGLMQRARDFASYEDPGARYDLRPSMLVEPLGDWGKGAVRLIEMPAKLETDDNIIAFWVPETRYKAGDSAEFRYRLSWGDLSPDPKGALAFVAATRGGQGGVSGVENKQTLRKFVVDFAGGSLAELQAEDVDAVATLTGGDGKIVFSSVTKLPDTGAMRLAIDAEIDSKAPIELRAYLVGGGQQLTETWLYQWRAA
ncbi:MAG: glucan biosynthesis protein [Devosia sp.]